MYDIYKLLRLAIEQKASDIHLSVGEPPIFRIDGSILRFEEVDCLTEEKVKEMLYTIMTDSQKKEYEENFEHDFSYPYEDKGRFRINVFKQSRGMASVMRLIPSKILSLDDLGINNAAFNKISDFRRGLVLVTGPTGSGKSTTLAAIINHINHIREEHIITIEDPIEFIHRGQKCLINQREVHKDTKSFNAALRSSLREDPDIILVGELRDLETIRLALTAAETGHVVFGTLHTNSATKTIDRIIDVFPGDEKPMIRSMLSESLQAVVSQVLLKKDSDNCSGGRVAAHEIMFGTDAIKNLIREDKVAQMYSCVQTSSNEGMITMDQSLRNLVNNKQVKLLEAASKSRNSKDFLSNK
jgi:twitching motility protein PilT